MLAAHARAVFNFCVLPCDTVADGMVHIRDVLDDDAIAVKCLDRWDPSPTSPAHGPGWGHVQATIAWLWPDAIVSPSLVLAATDARHYNGRTTTDGRGEPRAESSRVAAQAAAQGVFPAARGVSDS